MGLKSIGVHSFGETPRCFFFWGIQLNKASRRGLIQHPQSFGDGKSFLREEEVSDPATTLQRDLLRLHSVGYGGDYCQYAPERLCSQGWSGIHSFFVLEALLLKVTLTKVLSRSPLLSGNSFSVALADSQSLFFQKIIKYRNSSGSCSLLELPLWLWNLVELQRFRFNRNDC